MLSIFFILFNLIFYYKLTILQFKNYISNNSASLFEKIIFKSLSFAIIFKFYIQ